MEWMRHAFQLIRVATIFASSAFVVGCSCANSGDIGGVVIDVVDAVTHAAICDALISASDGKRSEQIGPSSAVAPCPYAGLLRAEGEFEISVTRAGYVTHQMHNVEFHKTSRCNDYERRNFVVALQPM